MASNAATVPKQYLLSGLWRLLLLLEEARELQPLVIAEQRLGDLRREQVPQRPEDGAAHQHPGEEAATRVTLCPVCGKLMSSDVHTISRTSLR